MNLVSKTFRASVGCSFSEPGTEGPQVCSERVMSFIRTAVFSQPGGAAWALGHAQPGKRRWKYFQQSVDCVNQDLNQLPGAVIQVGWERLVHLHAEWMRLSAAIRRSKILGSVADVKPLRSIGRALGITCVWGQSPGILIYVLIQLLPQKTTCRCLQERESWLSQLSFLLGYQCFASISECFLPEKCSQLYFFFPLALLKHCAFLLLASQLVPALPLVHTKSSLRHGEGMPRHSCSKLVYIRKKTNPKTFLQIKSLFSMERLELIFT